MTKEPRTTQKEAAWEVMEQAYMAASGNNTLPAMARQIYYQARPKIMALATGLLWCFIAAKEVRAGAEAAARTAH